MNDVKPKVILVGGGLAGLMAALRIAEAGMEVDLFSFMESRRSHSVCAQGGINASVNTKGEGDSPWIHFLETIYGGDFLANQRPVLRMCQAAPKLVYLLDRMGVMFNRTVEGNLMVSRRGGATKYSRGLNAGATTGQQILYALDEQVSCQETLGKIRRFEGWEFCSALLDEEGTCRGITAMNLNGRMEVLPFYADAVVLATGGCGALFKWTTSSNLCNGSASSAVHQQGAVYANAEFIQVHPTAIPGNDKCRLVSEALRGGGGRVWTYRDGKPWYFLEEWYPAYGNLVPRDIASRAIYKVCREMRVGIDQGDMVYLDITHLPSEKIEKDFAGVIELYEKFVGEDPRKVPMRVFPAVHYSMGGLWVDEKLMTNIQGLFALGECNYEYHGANRLGANALLSCLYDGYVSAQTVSDYSYGTALALGKMPDTLVEAEIDRQNSRNIDLLNSRGPENPYQLFDELAAQMNMHTTVVKTNQGLKQTLDTIEEIMDRYSRLDLQDTSEWANQSLSFSRQLWNMLVLARVIAKGGLERNESRGCHYKPEFPGRDDKHWLKTTLAYHTQDGPRLDYQEIDVSLFPPRSRIYEEEFEEIPEPDGAVE